MGRPKKEKAQFGDFIKTQVQFIKDNKNFLIDLCSKEISNSGFDKKTWNSLFQLMKTAYSKLKAEGYESLTKDVDYSNPEQKNRLSNIEVLWTNDRLRYIKDFLTNNFDEENQDSLELRTHLIFTHLSLMIRDIQKV